MNQDPVYYFGHHKCGSTWVTRILKQASQILNLRYDYLHNPSTFAGDLEAFTQKKTSEVVAFVNADVDYIPRIEQLRGFHVIRDPRDLVVSGYFSHLHSHSLTDELSVLRDKLKSLDFEKGLIEEIHFDKKFLDHIAKWEYDYQGILEFKYEDIVGNPYGIFIHIFEHLNFLEEVDFKTFLSNEIKRRMFKRLGLRYDYKLEKLPYELLVEIVRKNQFKNITGGRKRGSEDIKSHYRKGIPGDWKNHFSEKHKAYFKENYNDLLIRLGYEKDDKW